MQSHETTDVGNYISTIDAPDATLEGLNQGDVSLIPSGYVGRQDDLTVTIEVHFEFQRSLGSISVYCCNSE